MLITSKFRKRGTFKNVSFVILMLQICLISGQQKVIVLDPGHGGKDFGAFGRNGIKEKEVVLKVAHQILILNETLFDNGFAIYLTRYNDTLISLRDRSRLAKAVNADLFMSLHCNASSNVAGGTEVYAHAGKTEERHTKEAIALGLSILDESSLKLGFKGRGIQFSSFQVLRETTALCPAILVEMGFLTNVDEAEYFLKPENIRAMALAILMGLYN